MHRNRPHVETTLSMREVFFLFFCGVRFLHSPTKMLKVPSTAPKHGACFSSVAGSPQQTSIISNSMACHFSSFELPTNTMEKFIKWKNITIFHPHFPLQKMGWAPFTIPGFWGLHCETCHMKLFVKKCLDKNPHSQKTGEKETTVFFFLVAASKSG